MKRYFLLVLILLLGACSAPPALPAATSLPPVAVDPAIPSTATQPAVITPTATEALQPAPQATSRGDQLVASDPASVQIGAGKPVLLEFFRFT